MKRFSSFLMISLISIAGFSTLSGIQKARASIPQAPAKSFHTKNTRITNYSNLKAPTAKTIIPSSSNNVVSESRSVKRPIIKYKVNVKKNIRPMSQEAPTLLEANKKNSITGSASETRDRKSRLELDFRLASAALSTYDHLQNLMPGFTLCNQVDEGGFRAQTLCNEQDKEVIIAFRGTRNIEDIYFDLALFYGQEAIIGSVGNLYMNFGMLQDKFLTAIFTAAMLLARKVSNNPNIARKIDLHQRLLLGELNSKWKDYREKHLTPISFAEKVLNDRVGYVRDYTGQTLDRYSSLGYRVYLTGHSLGGLYAQLASMMYGIPGASFNAPGVCPILHECKNFDPKHGFMADFINHRHAKDWVSHFQKENHHGTVHLYEFERTDPFTAHNINTLINYLEEAELVGIENLDDLWLNDVEEAIQIKEAC